jgi:hypothetical protein
MKNNKHVESFGQFNENLNSELSKKTSSSISDVRRSFNEEDMEKSFKEGYNLALHHYKEYLSREIVGYDFLKDEPKDFYTFIKNYF